MGVSQADYDIAEGYAAGREDALRECAKIVKDRLVGWSITQNGLARQDEAEEILEAINDLVASQ